MACMEYSTDTYLKRHKIDTNPAIVRVLDSSGNPVDHWYYRSDQHLASDFFGIEGKVVQPFEGSIDKIPKTQKDIFAEGRYRICDESMQAVKLLVAMGMQDFSFADLFSKLRI